MLPAPGLWQLSRRNVTSADSGARDGAITAAAGITRVTTCSPNVNLSMFSQYYHVEEAQEWQLWLNSNMRHTLLRLLWIRNIYHGDDFKSIIEPTHELSVVDKMRFVLSDITWRYPGCQAVQAVSPASNTWPRWAININLASSDNLES